MISFATMFVGLVLGIQSVTVVVSDQVAAVELLLDGRQVAELGGPPWKAECDFGDELVPQTLEAVAYDRAGEELGRTRQRINLPGRLAEAHIVLEEPPDGSPAVARVVFESVLRTRPERVSVLFDGAPLEVADFERFPLPEYDRHQIHHLSVELEFPDNVATRAEITFGGEFTDRVGTPQTAVPVMVGKGRLPRNPGELYGSFLKDGEPLRVLAVDEGPAEVAIVRDLSAQRALDRLAADLRQRLSDRWRRATSSLSRLTGGASLAGVSLRFAGQLKRDQLVWLLEPFASSPGGAGYRIEAFDPSPQMTPRDGGLPYLLTTLRPPAEALHRQRLADAVAVAGRGAAQRDRRRAVVLIVAEGADASSLEPAMVRSYLKSVHVPLIVWSTAAPVSPGAERWGEIQDISSVNRFEREIKQLAELLDRQRIVWLEGFHLPQRISLAAGKPRLEFPM